MHLALFRGVPSFYTQHLDNSLHPSIYFLRLNLVQGRGVGGGWMPMWLQDKLKWTLDSSLLCFIIGSHTVQRQQPLTLTSTSVAYSPTKVIPKMMTCCFLPQTFIKTWKAFCKTSQKTQSCLFERSTTLWTQRKDVANVISCDWREEDASENVTLWLMYQTNSMSPDLTNINVFTQSNEPVTAACYIDSHTHTHSRRIISVYIFSLV